VGRLRRCSQAAGMCACVCVTRCSSSPPPHKWPKSSPFIVEGRTRTVHVLLCGVMPTGVACPSPVAYSCGGVVIGVVRPWSTGAAWLSHQILCIVGAPGMPRSGCGGERASHCGRTVRDAEAWSMPRLALRWGVSAGTNPKIAEASVYSAEPLSGRPIMGTAFGHSGR